VRRWLRVALLLLGTSTVTGALPVAGAGTSGVIVFDSDRDGDSDLYAVNPDGSALTQLTHNDVGDSSPLPSPNGRLIAFYNDSVGLAVVNADGSDRRALRGCTTGASWAPDSSRVACTTARGVGISVADPARGTVVPISATGHDPAWSPDGRTIAFVDAGLWLIPADGGTRRRLVNRILDAAPTWSPDSRRVAYAGEAGRGRFDLFVTNVDSSGERRLVSNVDPFDLEWSPQGSSIAFAKSVDRGVVQAIYTVRPDGTGLRRVSVSTGGESSREPSWTGDGTTLVYARQRFSGAIQSDVFVMTPGAAPGRALTNPFPLGGTNDGPRWLAGPPLVTPPPQGPRALALTPSRTLVLPASRARAVATIDADGARAVVPYGSCAALVWEPVARRTLRLPPLCVDLNLRAIVLSGTRVASLVDAFGNTEAHDELDVARIGARRRTYVTAASAFTNDGHATYDSGAALHHLRGGGGTIAFTISRFGSSEADSTWVLLAGRGASCPSGADWKHARLCRRVAGGVTAAVDAGRVLTIAPGGVVRLLATSGGLLHEWTLGPGIADAALQGRTLVIQRGASLTLYDTATGAATGTRSLARDEGEPPALVDVHGDLAAYNTGGAIHLLRLSDGRDLALTLPRAAPPFSAQLEASGLFLRWNRMYDRRPARVTFVSRRAIEAAIERGG
jgi:Tol biopolymer transport system component